MHARPEMPCWIGLTGPAFVTFTQCYFVVDYAHFAFSVLPYSSRVD